MKITESKLNKMLDEVWQSAYRPNPIDGVVLIGKSRMPYRVINDDFVRVYKKYGYMPKPKKVT